MQKRRILVSPHRVSLRSQTPAGGWKGEHAVYPTIWHGDVPFSVLLFLDPSFSPSSFFCHVFVPLSYHLRVSFTPTFVFFVYRMYGFCFSLPSSPRCRILSSLTSVSHSSALLVTLQVCVSSCFLLYCLVFCCFLFFLPFRTRIRSRHRSGIPVFFSCGYFGCSFPAIQRFVAATVLQSVSTTFPFFRLLQFSWGLQD